MSIEIKVPALGESVTEATIGQWYKKVGDAVIADEPLVELETDKVTIELPAPVAGTIEAITARQGETVAVGALIGAIAESAAGDKAKPTAAVARPKQMAAEATPQPNGQAKKAEITPAKPAAAPPAPSAAKMLAEAGIDPGEIKGSGKRGQVLKEDVTRLLEKATAPAPVAAKAVREPSVAGDEAREERVKMTRLRQTIARRLKDAQNSAAMLTTFNEVDMKPVMDLRGHYKELFEKKHGVKLGFMGFFTMAVCHGLKEIPAVNAEIDGDEIVYKNYAHIGVAVGTEKGLVVPVVRDADTLGIAEIETEIARLGAAARDGKLTMQDMQGGTFTISNGGVYGSLMSTPILNAPQSGILGMHKIEERPVVVAGQIVIRPMMYLALSYDHRVVDGREAVTFLIRVKESLEDPQRLVLDL
ncbi:MAG: 2-oxoglutarate dehydrogenase complex dihydrolipoyllysine-residue succinyltransferase [Cucumibacter sp.]